MSGGPRRVAFDRFVADLRAHQLFHDGLPVAIQEKPFRLLVALLERAGDVVTRDELCDALWPSDTHVEREAGLNTAIRKLRAALGSTADRDLLETVPRVGYRLMVTSRFVPSSAQDGSFDAPLADPVPSGPWSARWRLAVGGALALAATVFVQVTAIRAPSAPDPMPDSYELRALYVEARGLLATGENLTRARELLRSLAEQAPEFAPGHAHLAEVSAWIGVRTGAEGDIEASRRAAERALVLDPDSAVAHRARAMVALHFDRDPRATAAALDRALQVGPDDPVNYLARATFESILGRHRTALAAIRRAVDLAPDTMSIRSDAGFFLLRAGRYDEAIAECEMVLRLDDDNGFGLDCLVMASSLAGDPEGARSAALRAMEIGGAPENEIAAVGAAADPRVPYLTWALHRLLALPKPPPVQVAARYLALGDDARALEWLGRAAHDGAPDLVYVPGDVRFARLGGGDRYEQILRQAGLQSLTSS